MGSLTRCIVEWIIGAITAAAGLIGTVWGIVKYYDQKRVNEKNEQNEREDRREKLLTETLEGLNSVHTTMSGQALKVDSLVSVLSNIDTKLEEMQEQIDTNEMDRLRHVIIEGMLNLQNGLEVSQVYLEHIHHCYDKYKNCGGNSYIDSCMANIVEYEEECRRISMEED